MPGLLHIQDLVVGYKDRVVAGPLTAEMATGQVIALLGRNGSGKSTLLRTLAGLQPALQGSVSMQGKDLTNLSAANLARMRAIVLSGRQHVVGEMRAGELFRMSRPWNESSREEQVLALLQLQGWEDRKLATLSDGEYQRVMIARALVQDTPLVLLDEPTAHLDVVHALDTFRLLQRLPAELGSTVLFASHNIERALDIADHCLLLDDKGQVHQGSPDQLIKDGKVASVFSAPGIRFRNDTRRLEFDDQ